MCMFCRSLFVLLYFFFWPLCCLFFFDIRILITPFVSFGHCVVCSSSIYGFWLPLWYLQTLHINGNRKTSYDSTDFIEDVASSGMCICVGIFALRWTNNDHTNPTVANKKLPKYDFDEQLGTVIFSIHDRCSYIRSILCTDWFMMFNTTFNNISVISWRFLCTNCLIECLAYPVDDPSDKM
jgi:fatty-acid desaturase